MESGSTPPVFVVALTGGIASGKSRVSFEFEKLGVPVIDTDKIARDLVKPGQPLLAAVIDAFGVDLLDDSGRLRRRALRELIFSDPDKRKLLESLLHPAIAGEALRRIGSLSAPYCILTIPLLAETDVGGFAHRVLVVDVPAELQIRRLMARDEVGLEQARAALAAQVAREERLAMADDVIDNSGTIAELGNKVVGLHRKYLDLARRLRAAASMPER